jgi:type IV fimbrial biogenesis protein FimT
MKVTHSICLAPGRRSRARGFTLIELLVTLTVLAILLGIGVPSFNHTISATRLSNNANELVGGLNLARSEAVRRGQNVTFHSADASANFHTGWEVMTDSDGDGLAPGTVTTADGTVVRVQQAVSGSTTVKRVDSSNAVLTSSDKGYVVFNARGGNPAGAAYFLVCDSGNTSLKGRRIQVSAVGRVSVDNSSASCT